MELRGGEKRFIQLYTITQHSSQNEKREREREKWPAAVGPVRFGTVYLYDVWVSRLTYYTSTPHLDVERAACRVAADVSEITVASRM